MFGYININKMELKVKEYYQYKGYYCGLCKTLKKEFGHLSRLTLNYDMTYLIILLSSLYEVESRLKIERCVVHPLNKQRVITNQITLYGAAMNVLLSYYKCKDNWQDEKDIKSLLYEKSIHRAFRNAVKCYPEKAAQIKKHLEHLNALEKNQETDLDTIAHVFGLLMSEIAVYKKDQWEKYLKKIGYYLGRYIYILDAYDDLEKDIKNHAFNPLKSRDRIGLDEEIYQILTLQLSCIDKEIEKLPLFNDKGILDNILYSGILTQLKMKTGSNKEEFIDERSI